MLSLVLIVVGVLGLLGAPKAAATPDEGQARARLAGLRLPFMANEGQVDGRVAFYAPGADGTLFVTRAGQLVYSLSAPARSGKRERRVSDPRPGWTLTETLRDGRTRPIGHDASTTGVSYFLGDDPARWRPTVATYERVGLGEVWPGVNVSLVQRAGGVEKIFTVEPGASVARIRVRVGGASALAVSPDGALVARTGLGSVTLTAPIAYQERDGVRRPVAVSYRLEGREYGFVVASYDSTLPLMIDPLLRSTYLGGSGSDLAIALASHPTTGDVYVGGIIGSAVFPGTAGGAQAAYGGGANDGFVARLNSSLTALLQATFLGGSAGDVVTALAIHPTTGDVYAAGNTASTNFPATAGGAQPATGGGRDAVVARFNGSLTALIQATYYGGSGDDYAWGLAIHPTTGNVYICGQTLSTNLPNTIGGAQPAYGGGDDDGFVVRLPPGLTAVTQATYLGGSQSDYTYALAVHPTTGDVYTVGLTVSTNFPGTAGSAQPTYGGGNSDAFAARLTSALTTLTKATYLGGTGAEIARAVVVHPSTGDVYTAGDTVSTNFPATAGGAQAAYGGGGSDGFVARLTSGLTSLTQATYIGGSDLDVVYAMGIHPSTGEVYAGGYTYSMNFPGVTGAVQTAYAGSSDGYVARLSPTLTSLIQATFLGGSGQDIVQALAFRATTGDVYVAGQTASTNFPGVSGGAQATYGGGDSDAFASRLTFSLLPVDPHLSLTATVNQSTFAVGQTLTMSATATDPGVPGTADFCLGALLPDGVTLVFWTGPSTTAVGSLNDLRSFRPYAVGVPLGPPFITNLPNFLVRPWNGTEPRGVYTLFHFAIRAGALAAGTATSDDVLGLVTSTFAFP